MLEPTGQTEQTEEIEYDSIDKLRIQYFNHVSRIISILMNQFGFTIIMIFICHMTPILSNLIMTNSCFLAKIMMGGSLLILLLINLMKVKTYFQLIIFTLFQTLFCCAITINYNLTTVVFDTMLTCFVIGSTLFCYGMRSETHEKGLENFLFSGSILLVMMWAIDVMFGSHLIRVSEPYLVTAMMMGYIAYDAERFLTKKITQSTPDDIHITAALNIYFDIIVLFLRLFNFFI
jgi:FtsH-binding integral membrane protein